MRLPLPPRNGEERGRRAIYAGIEGYVTYQDWLNNLYVLANSDDRSAAMGKNQHVRLVD